LAVFGWTVDRATGMSGWEVPLSGISGIAHDDVGRTYVGTEDYSRIQVYSPNGKFLYGIDVGESTGEGLFEFRAEKDGTLDVYGFRTQSVTRYTWVAGRLTHVQLSDSWTGFGKARLELRPDSSGNVDRVGRWAWLWPRIVRRTPAGEEVTLISQSLLLWLVKVPLPTMPLVIIPLAVLWYSWRREQAGEVRKLAAEH
jgi:hypothetical protein